MPQDVAFLPDGKFLVADGLGNNRRIVVRNADGSYHSEFGEPGDEPHQFTSIHSWPWVPMSIFTPGSRRKERQGFSTNRAN